MDNPNGNIQLSKEYLEELISFEAKKLVGKVCKRFELSQDKNFIKDEARELIYEGFRDFRDLLLAYDKGLEISQFNFTNNKGEVPPSGDV